jgi:sigma-E factor negative regulatory protein RseC
MLTETGRVVAIEANAVWVETIRSSSCGRCAARAGCGHGALAMGLQKNRGLVRVRDSAKLTSSQCELDDQVEIQLPESAVLLASATVYALPLLLAIGFAIGAAPWGELPAVIGFVSGLLVGFGVARWLVGAGRGGESFEPMLVARVAPVIDADLIVRQGAGGLR